MRPATLGPGDWHPIDPCDPPDVQCWCCDERVSADAVEEYRGEMWCEKCLEEHVACCECDEPVKFVDAVLRRDVKTGAWDYWCEDCAEPKKETTNA